MVEKQELLHGEERLTHTFAIFDHSSDSKSDNMLTVKKYQNTINLQTRTMYYPK